MVYKNSSEEHKNKYIIARHMGFLTDVRINHACSCLWRPRQQQYVLLQPTKSCKWKPDTLQG